MVVPKVGMLVEMMVYYLVEMMGVNLDDSTDT